MDPRNIMMAAVLGVVALIGFAVLAALDKRYKEKGPIGGEAMRMPLMQDTGPASRGLGKVWMVFLAIALIAVAAAIITGNFNIAWIGVGALVIMSVLAFARTAARLARK